jgi:signal transduction histidine kinase
MATLNELERLLSDENPAAVLLVENGRIVASNAAAMILLGPGAAAGVQATSLFDEGSQGKLAVALASDKLERVELQSVQAGHEPLAVQFVVEPRGGRRLLLARSPGPADAARMETILLDANARLANLTRELAQRGAELAASKARLEHLAALREEFLAALSHDIKSPLTAILLAAAVHERSAEKPTPEGIVRFSQSIRRNAERILHLVNEILDVARLDSGRIERARHPVSLAAIASEVIESVDAVASRAGVRIEVRPAFAEDWVAGTRLRLFQVLVNLVSNAVRHSPSGGTVRIEIEAGGEMVRCAVRDQGPGVPPELRPRLFERFRQGGGNTGSVGLGLYIVRRIVELYGGRVWLEDAVPTGAVFVFELPKSLPPSRHRRREDHAGGP